MNPTEKQLKVIKIIEENLGINFKGTTKNEASQFIRKHIEQSKQEAEQDRFYNELMGLSLPNQ